MTGVAAKYLANPDSEVVGMIGCGVQARTQIMAMKAAIPSVKLLKGYDIRGEASQQFTQWASGELGIEAVPVGSAREAVVGSDMIATVTVANEPIVKDAWLKKGSFFAHVGSYQEEEEAVIFNTDKVVVDLWHEVLHRGTPLLILSWKMYRANKYGYPIFGASRLCWRSCAAFNDRTAARSWRAYAMSTINLPAGV